MKKILAPIALCLLLATSCKKEEPNNSVTIPTYKTYSSMDEIFNELSLKPKVVSIDAATGASFYGNSGTRYIFQPNCFIDGTGAIVTGSVQIEVTEWLNKGDMIFSGVLPISNGESIVSAGEIYARASKGGKELFIKPGMSFRASIPQFGTKDTTMQFFRGIQSNGDPSNRVNWVVPEIDSSKINAVLARLDSMDIISDSLKYCNADQFVRNMKDQEFTITVMANNSKIITADGIRTYALYDTRKAMYRCGLSGSKDGVYMENHIPSIPIHIVSFCLINGHFYGGVQAATPKTGENYTVTLKEVDPKEFKAQIALYP